MTRRDDEDLIYEGIATSQRIINFFRCHRRRRPDLRRDCDSHLCPQYTMSPRDDEDLIYEGIATLSNSFHNPCLDGTTKT